MEWGGLTQVLSDSTWVRSHAQDYILEYFRLLTDRRKQAHTAHLDRITNHAYHFFHAPPHPNEIAAAQAALKRGIDEDWQASVQRYPEVLEYFYSLGMFPTPLLGWEPDGGRVVELTFGHSRTYITPG